MDTSDRELIDAYLDGELPEEAPAARRVRRLRQSDPAVESEIRQCEVIARVLAEDRLPAAQALGAERRPGETVLPRVRRRLARRRVIRLVRWPMAAAAALLLAALLTILAGRSAGPAKEGADLYELASSPLLSPAREWLRFAGEAEEGLQLPALDLLGESGASGPALAYPTDASEATVDIFLGLLVPVDLHEGERLNG